MRRNTSYTKPLFCSCVVVEEMWIKGAHVSHHMKIPHEVQVLRYDTMASDDVCVLILHMC